MDEMTWLSSTDPQAMLAFLRESGKLYERGSGGGLCRRKARLFCVAVWRRIWPLFLDERSRRWVVVLERRADGAVSPDEFEAAAVACDDAAWELEWAGPGGRTDSAYAAAWSAAAGDECDIARFAAGAVASAEMQVERAECVAQAALLRDIFANPFRPPAAIEAAWLARNGGAVRKLAEGIYQERAFEKMPLLADALESAGCADVDILSHCREPGGVHVRGCYVLDLLLGKEKHAMTDEEEQWLACTDPTRMLDLLRGSGKLCERLARLFTVAVCGRIRPLLTDERSRTAVDVLERYADGTAGVEELAAAAQAAQAAADDQESTDAFYAAAVVANAVHSDLPPECRGGKDDQAPIDCISDASDAAFAAVWVTGHALHPENSGDAWFAATKADEAVQCRLLRCVAGNPFRPPPTLDPAWLTRAVLALAQSAYDDRLLPAGTLYPAHLGELAAALEAAGCGDTGLLEHLRCPGPHVRGCYAVDVLLGKS